LVPVDQDRDGQSTNRPAALNPRVIESPSALIEVGYVGVALAVSVVRRFAEAGAAAGRTTTSANTKQEITGPATRHLCICPSPVP
jgi:hypothetical protein